MISVNNGLPEIAEHEDMIDNTEQDVGTNGTVNIGTLEQMQRDFNSTSNLSNMRLKEDIEDASKVDNSQQNTISTSRQLQGEQANSSGENTMTAIPDQSSPKSPFRIETQGRFNVLNKHVRVTTSQQVSLESEVILDPKGVEADLAQILTNKYQVNSESQTDEDIFLEYIFIYLETVFNRLQNQVF